MREPTDELAELKAANLLRSIPPESDSLIDFASNDYLGLSKHPEVTAALTKAAAEFGVGSTASRLICGTSAPHRDLEEYIATAKGTETALTFATGYATSTGVLTALLGKGDTIILDKLSHASLIDGARMSGATLRVFPHNHLGKLEELLKKSTSKAHDKLEADARVIVVTESVFSMDGDTAPLLEIIALCETYGALLMLDEAHALGVLGPHGMGLAEQLGAQDRITLQMGTLGKAAGVGGGYIAASQSWIDLITNKARSFIYSTAPPPAQAAAAKAALTIIRSDEGTKLRETLWQNIRTLQQDAQSAIIPWHIGKSEHALTLASQLRESGFLVPAIRFPTVPRNTARLRITLSASHQQEDIQRLKERLGKP